MRWAWHILPLGACHAFVPPAGEPHRQDLLKGQRQESLEQTQRVDGVPIFAERAGLATPARNWAVGVAGLVLISRIIRGRSPRSRLAVAAEGGTVDEVEVMFREAFEAEMERASLLQMQVEAAVQEKLQVEGNELGVKISFDGAGPLSPEQPGGKATWREAFEAAKAWTTSLEGQLKKARATAAPVPTPPPLEVGALPGALASDPSPTSSTSTMREERTSTDDVDSEEVLFNKLEELSKNSVDDEALLRFIAVPILGRSNDPKLTQMPPVSQITALISGEFTPFECMEFDRVLVYKGLISQDKPPAATVEALQRRFSEGPYAGLLEGFLAEGKDGRILFLVMLKEDLPKKELAWWQNLLCAGLLVWTLLSVNFNTVGVSSFTNAQLDAMTAERLAELLTATIPTAISVLTVVASQELARRTVAAREKVELAPPFLVPVWPLPSIGCLGAISRSLSTIPNRNVAVQMSAAAGIAGFLTSLLILIVGLLQPAEDGTFMNLNYQLLPTVLKVVLKPILGSTPLSTQADPFSDPVNVAFPANAYTIGAVSGLLITALNMLPIGRLDGGTLLKAALGNNEAEKFVIASGVMLILGSGLSPLNSEQGLMYVSFGVYALLLQSGFENPPADGITKLDPSLRTIALVLVVLGFLFTIPPLPIPGL